MLRLVGRTLQIIALVVLPLSMYMQVSGGLGRSFNVSEMVIMLIFGICAFYVGRILEGYGTK